MCILLQITKDGKISKWQNPLWTRRNECYLPLKNHSRNKILVAWWKIFPSILFTIMVVNIWLVCLMWYPKDNTGSTFLFPIYAVHSIGRMRNSKVLFVFILMHYYELRWCGIILFPCTCGFQNYTIYNPFCCINFFWHVIVLVFCMCSCQLCKNLDKNVSFY